MSKYIATANSQSDLVTGIKLPVLCIFRSKYPVVFYVVPFVEDSYYKRYSPHYARTCPSQVAELKKDKFFEFIYVAEDILNSYDELCYVSASEFEKELIVND